MDLSGFSKSASDLSKNPLGIIALFIVLVYGFACLLFSVSANVLTPNERIPIILFVVLFPITVLILFGWLVSKHHNKLYAPTDYRDDSSFLRSFDQQKITNNERYIKDLIEVGGDSEILSERVKLIKSDMDKRGLTYSSDSEEVLIRQLAACQNFSWFEKTYYNIFGSQIEILIKSHSNEGISESNAIEIFNSSKNRNPDFLSNYTYDTYMNYLFQCKLVERLDSKLVITKLGIEFINLLETSQYSKIKAL